MAVINESMLEEATTIAEDKLAKEGFGNYEPIDGLELRPFPLSKIKDLDQYEREIIQTTLNIEGNASARQDFSAGDLVVQVDANTDVVYYEASGSTVSLYRTTSNVDGCIKLDCGSGVVVDKLRIKLNKVASPTGTLDCDIYTTFDENDTTVGSSVETSSTPLTVSGLGTSPEIVEFDFAGNVYEGEIIFRLSGLSVSATNYLELTIGGSQDNHTRLQTFSSETVGDTWTQLNDAWVYIIGEYTAGIYKAHGDFLLRSQGIMEVLEDVSSGGNPKLNATGILYKQSGLTENVTMFLQYDGTIDNSGTGVDIGFSLTDTIVRLNKPASIEMEIIAGTDYVSIYESGIPLGNSVTNTVYEVMISFISGAEGTYQLDYDLAIQGTTATDKGYASIRVNGVEVAEDTLTDPTTSGSFSHDVYLPANAELSIRGKIEDNAGAGTDTVKINGLCQVRYSIQPKDAELVRIV